VYVEKPKTETLEAKYTEPIKKAEAYQTTEVLLNTGERALIQLGDATVRTVMSEALTISSGRKFMVGEEIFVFGGVVKSKDKTQDGKIAGYALAQKNLYRLFTPDEVEKGILQHNLQELAALALLELKRIKKKSK